MISNHRANRFRAEARKGLTDAVLQKALAGLQQRLGPATAEAYRRLPEGPDLRLKAHDLRMAALENLDRLLVNLAERIRKNGGRVFFAQDGKAAANYCLEVARKHRVKLAVKGKSMVTEEIGLNSYLEAAGIEVAEADLGEFIVQLAGEHPSHIIAPAIHKTRKEIGELFAEKLGIPYTDDPPALTQAARKALREKFLAADMGISGCNLACAETGHITTVSNEGNIRMATTLPRVHVALMGMERVTTRLEDFDVMFRLLCRGAAAQNMATYVSHIGGPRSLGQGDGPEEFHLVIIDNGRSKILADNDFREILCCIRCAACLNVCPAYGKVGGHAYGFAYSGPIGAVITPLLTDINQAADLCFAETLCGACQDACPINIDIPRMLLALRYKLAEGDPVWGVKSAGMGEKLFFKLWSVLIGNRRFYDLALRMAAVGQNMFPNRQGMISRLPYPLSGWTKSRDIKALAGESFMTRWRRMNKN
jgi:L-lactate dehydrogenase complex protein LldF